MRDTFPFPRFPPRDRGKRKGLTFSLILHDFYIKYLYSILCLCINPGRVQHCSRCMLESASFFLLSTLLILCSCIIASHPAPRGRGAKGRCVKRKHKSYFSLHATFASRHNPIGPHTSRPRCNWSKRVCFDSNASRHLGWCWGFGGLYYIRLEMLCFGRC